jgi:hypothetical protein
MKQIAANSDIAENDPNTCLLRTYLIDGVLTDHE